MKEEKARFHITITDNETGEIEVDSDTCAIIGSYDDDEKGPASIVMTHCPMRVTLSTYLGAQEACKKIREGNSAVEALLQIYEILKKAEEDK